MVLGIPRKKCVKNIIRNIHRTITKNTKYRTLEYNITLMID